MCRSICSWQLLLLVVGLVTPFATADIISVQNTGQACSSVSGTLTVACTYNYSAVNGATNPLIFGIGTAAGSSGLYVVHNNSTTTTDTSISFTWSGMIAQNQFLNCQFGGGESGNCTVTGSGGGTGSGTALWSPCAGSTPNSNCNSSQSGSLLIPLSATFTWSFSPGVAPGNNFDISFSSWANGATTTPTAVPEPSSMLLLLVSGALGLVGVKRRKLQRTYTHNPSTKQSTAV